MSSLDTQSLSRVLQGVGHDEILRAEARLRTAQLQGDVAELDELIDEALLFVGPAGELATKAQDIAAHADKLVQFIRHEPLEFHVRILGNDLVATVLKTRLELTFNAESISGSFVYSRLWQRSTKGSWRIMAGQVSQFATA